MFILICRMECVVTHSVYEVKIDNFALDAAENEPLDVVGWSRPTKL